MVLITPTLGFRERSRNAERMGTASTMREKVLVRYQLTSKQKKFILETSYGSPRDSWVGRAIIAVATKGVEIDKGYEGLASTKMKNAVLERLHNNRRARGLCWVDEGYTPNYLHGRIADVLRWIAWCDYDRRSPVYYS